MRCHSHWRNQFVYFGRSRIPNVKYSQSIVVFLFSWPHNVRCALFHSFHFPELLCKTNQPINSIINQFNLETLNLKNECNAPNKQKMMGRTKCQRSWCGGDKQNDNLLYIFSLGHTFSIARPTAKDQKMWCKITTRKFRMREEIMRKTIH